MKREPLLVDKFLAMYALPPHQRAKPYLLNHTFGAKVAGRLREAKRFVFDIDAARYVGEMTAEIPKAIVHAQEFAIPPFPQMYIEFDPRPIWTAVQGFLLHKADTRMGFLYDHGRVYVLADTDDGETPSFALMPMSYGLHRQMTQSEEQTLCEVFRTSRIGLDAFFWGHSYHFVDEDERRMFRSHHSMRFEFPPEATDEIKLHAGGVMVDECAGDLRTIIAMLLFLNRTSGERVEREVQTQPAMLFRKPSALVKHTVISFRLNPIPRLRQTFGQGSTWRREHDVRGHFCHDERARNGWCMHDWQEQARAPGRQWRCMKCGGLRWRKDPFKRGHKEKGEVIATYEVHK